MNFALAVQIFGFLVSHKDDIKALITSIESLLGDVPGSSKAATVKSYIGVALNAEAQIEGAWPLVAPIFNAFVAKVKAPA